jgi:hypothetical protein
MSVGVGHGLADGAAISKVALAPYVADFTMLDTDNDATIDADEFMAGCKGES